ncbi:MAG TPA: response regulator [Acetobacteraceae bacterium]|nr:response regulator [Acetobacteraceae bacterium]
MPNRPLIVIVDDDESVRTALGSLVRAVGFGAQAFASAEEFLVSRHQESAACLILDVNMPGMSGSELHRRLVKSGRAIPTILITGTPDDEARKSAVREGVVCYLGKPVPAEDLLACVHSALGRSHRAPASRE